VQSIHSRQIDVQVKTVRSCSHAWLVLVFTNVGDNQSAVASEIVFFSSRHSLQQWLSLPTTAFHARSRREQCQMPPLVTARASAASAASIRCSHVRMRSWVPSVEPVSIMYHESMCGMIPRNTTSSDDASFLTILKAGCGVHDFAAHFIWKWVNGGCSSCVGGGQMMNHACAADD
jgi:hypothetical protein